MYYGKVWKAAVLISGIILLTGCEKTAEEAWTPRESDAVSIDADGKVTEYLSEELDQSYYSFEELSSMLNSEVASYNKEYGEGTVSVTKAEQSGKKAELVITYASGEDFARFNNVEFYYGSMINAQLEGYLFDCSYQRVKDGVVEEGALSGSEVLKHMAEMVVVVQAPLEVHVPGTVSFTSTNGTVISADTVVAGSDGEADEAEEAEEDASDRVYIVFKEDF